MIGDFGAYNMFEIKGDSNPNEKHFLSERALWTMNFDTRFIKSVEKWGSYGHLKKNI